MSGAPNLAAGMMTHSGQMVGMHHGVPTLEDIALSLSRIPRFGGHCRVNWSVLNHSLVCHRIALNDGAPRGLRLLALLHDAHEALTGDVPSPLKVPQLKELQKQLDARIFAEYLPEGLYDNAAVHDIDYRALLAEAVTVGPPGLGMHNVVELFGSTPRPTDIAVVEVELACNGGDFAHEAILAAFLETYECLAK